MGNHWARNIPGVIGEILFSYIWLVLAIDYVIHRPEK
jgi:hypothetical protein